MKLWLRVLTAAGIFIVAFAGCQQGKQGASAKPPEAEIRAADAKSTKSATSDKSHKVRAKAVTATATKERSKTASKTASKESSKSAHDAEESRESHAGTMKPADDGREITMRPGQTETVVLESNHANGFAWALVSPEAGVLVPEGKGMYAVKSGGHGTETWRFRAARPGRQTVRLEYRTEWTKNTPERTFRFTATVK
ncbi:MAG TPA: protease inhibitor I42 family protein [Candidatus Limnocylindrales bacterium]|nr:protease inhibitor I42 family protein [Candidatus Limnocylindrales bacterium]